MVVEAVTGWDATGLKKLASAVTSTPGMVVVLIGTDPPAPVVVARSKDVAIDAGDILKALIDRYGGKGGGKGAMAQGGGLTGPVQEILESVGSLIPTS